MCDRAQGLCESRGGRPGLSGATSPNGCGRKATLKKTNCVLSELRSCGRRSGRPGLPVPDSLYGLCGRRATLKKTNCVGSELRSCVKVEVDVLGSLSLIVSTVSVDVKQR